MNAQQLLDNIEVEYTDQEVVDINITRLFGASRSKGTPVMATMSKLDSHSQNGGKGLRHVSRR